MAITKPQVEKTVAELTDISKISSNKPGKPANDITLLSLQKADGSILRASTSSAYFDKVGVGMEAGSVVAVEYENRVAGKTGYDDGSGNLVAHTSDGTNLTNITKASKSAFERECNRAGRSGSANEALKLLGQQDEDMRGHAALLLGTMFK